MKCMIVLSLAILAHGTPIYPQDTPEVAAAKAEHIAEVQRAYAAAGVPFYPNVGFASSGVPVVGPDGFVVETPEVAAARAVHLAEKARITSVSPAYTPGYAPAPPAYSPPPPAYSPAYSPAPQSYSPPPPAYSPAPPAYSPVPPAYSPSPYYSPYYSKSTGPFAVPVVTPSGHLADTPEVAAAKAAHFAEVSKALAQIQRY